MRNSLAHNVAPPGEPMPSNLHMVEETKQIKFIQTVIRNRETSRDEFIFYSNRLMRVLIEHALSLLSFNDVTVRTTNGLDYVGKRSTMDTRVCGVSILRAGECMEPALCEVYKDARIGKILIQTNDKTGDTEVNIILSHHSYTLNNDFFSNFVAFVRIISFTI